MLETSRDVFFITLSFCALWLSFFLAWLLYYLIKAFRDLSRAARKFEEAADEANRLFALAKEKIENSVSHFMLAAELMRKGFDLLQSYQQKRQTKRTTKKTAK